MKLLLIIVSLVLGHYFGWHGAHSDIAYECNRLGGFYVGNKVYGCYLKEVRDAKT